MAKKRRRNVHLNVMVTPEERELIQQRMDEAGIRNMGAYMRKMALNGYVLNVDLAPVREIVSLQRRCANNLNQVAIHANSYGVYPEEISTAKGLRGPVGANVGFNKTVKRCCQAIIRILATLFRRSYNYSVQL